MRIFINVDFIIKYGDFIMDIGNYELEVIRESYVLLDNLWRHSNVFDPFTRLYYVKNGKAFLKYGNRIIEMHEGNVYMVPAGLNFEYWCDAGNTLEKLYFHISIMTFENYDLLSMVKDIYELPLKKIGCREIFDIYHNDDYVSMLKIKTMLYMTVAAFFAEYNLPAMPYNIYSELVKNTMKYIRKKPTINQCTEEIAREMFVSPSKLRNSFKAETGITLGTYIDDMVFYRAKRFLGSKKLSIAEISSRLGFCDQFYFSRRFKEKYGKTPSEYRRELHI